MCPGQIHSGLPVAQLGIGGEIFSCQLDVAGVITFLGLIYGMRLPLFLELLINNLVTSWNEGSGLSAWPDLT